MAEHRTNFRSVNITDVLEEAGFIVYKNGTREIDWSKTRAVDVGLVHIFINLKGREPDGIVDPADYEATQREIIAALHAYKDPETGRHPFTLALTHADAEMVNLTSNLVGDVVYALRPEFDGAHGKQLPSVSFGIGGQHSTFILSGALVSVKVWHFSDRYGLSMSLQRSVICWVSPCLATLKGALCMKRWRIQTGT